MNLAFGVLGWVLAGIGWTVALLALFLAIRFRADWSEIWKTAWLLRQAGWTVPGEVQDALTSRLGPQVPVGSIPRGPLREATIDVASIELPDPILRLIAESSETWHQEEMAQTARQMIAGGAGEHEIVHRLRIMMQEAGVT